MLTLKVCVLFLCISEILTQQACNTNVFRNVTVNKFSGDYSDPSKVKVQNIAELQDAYHIEIVNQSLPVLCSGSIKDLPKLDKLKLQNDGITGIEAGAFQNVPVLRDVRISYNKIKTIKKGVFNYLNVKLLNLQHNGIETIENGAFDNMPELTILELDINDISTLDPTWFTGSPKVRRLSMAENKLESIPAQAFKNMGANTVDIWLQDNKISKVDPNAFDGITRANYVWLQDNQIKELDARTFANVEKIQHLSLNANKIKCLSGKFLDNVHATSVNFDDNPYDCECLRSVKAWARQLGIESKFMISQIQCSIERSRKVLEESRRIS